MGNSQRGEVTLEVLGKSYTLAFNMNAMCELEGLLSTAERPVSFMAAMKQLRVPQPQMILVRAFIWSSLRKHHRDMTLDDAGSFLDAAGGVTAFSEQLASLAKAASPDAEDAEEAGANGRPRKAQGRSRAGTGVSLKSKPGASA